MYNPNEIIYEVRFPKNKTYHNVTVVQKEIGRSDKVAEFDTSNVENGILSFTVGSLAIDENNKIIGERITMYENCTVSIYPDGDIDWFREDSDSMGKVIAWDR